jgi:hypothetical protein
MLKRSLLWSLLALLPFWGCAQAPSPDAPAKPTEHVLGTVSAVDPSAHTITVKDDKTATDYVVSLANTHTLLKVEPGAKDLHSAVRITAGDLAVADRVDVRGFKSEAPNGIDAKSVVLMSGHALAQKHQAELQAWQNSTAGTVTSVDPSTQSVKITVRADDGPKPIVVQSSAATEYTRYSPDNPEAAGKSKLADIQVGDQLHVVGQQNADGSSISAEKVYSAPVRNVAATVTSISADGKQLVVKNLQTKQPATILLTDNSTVRKLPPQMAMFLARRLNPAAANANAAGGSPNAGGGNPNAGGAGTAQRNPSGSGPTPAAGTGTSGDMPHPGAPRMDMSHMLERVPAISAADLKPGDAIVIWGFAGHDPSSLVASTVLAGVEPVLQSAPPRQGQSSLSSDWGLNMAVPAQ